MRRLISLLCIFALTLSVFSASVQAEEIKLRTKTSVSIREKASTSSKSLGTVKAGTILTQVSVEGNWVKVTYRGDTGYVPKGTVTKIATVTTNTIKVGGAILYKNASTSSQKLATLKKGTSVRVYSSTSSWVKVQYYGKTGYIQAKYFQEKEDTTNSASPTIAPTATSNSQQKYTVAYVTLDSLTLYASASAKSKKVGSLPYGIEVHIYGTQGNYKKVTCNGQKGYVYGKYLSLSVPKKPEDEAAVPVYGTLKSGDEGAAVKALQERLIELGYLSGVSDGKYGTKTVAAVKLYQTTVNIDVSGIADEKTQASLFSTGAPEAPISMGNVTPSVVVNGVKAVDWFTGGIQNVFTVGTIVTVTDVQTGISWQEKRTGGWYHADCQPLTAADTAKMLRACGSWSWTRRPIWVTIGSSTYAASMNCMPHGDSDSMPNNGFDGCHCIHFTNSKVHGRNCVDSDHQAAIAKALAAAK